MKTYFREICIFLVGLLVPMTLGCSEPVCEGKPLSYWLKQARDKDDKFRAKAITALGETAKESSKAAGVVVEALKDESVVVRLSAVHSIGDLVKSEPKYIAILTTALADDDVLVRKDAAWALSIGPDAREATVPLSKLLGEPRQDVQSAAINALEKIGPPAREALPALRTLLVTCQEEEQEAENLLKTVEEYTRGKEGLREGANFARRLTGKPDFIETERERDQRQVQDADDISIGRKHWAEAKVRRESVEVAIKKIEAPE